MDYIETWKEVIQRPSDFYRKMPTTGGYNEPLTFAAISYIIYGLLTGLFGRGMMRGMYGYGGITEFGFSTVLMTVIMAPIVGIISIFIGAAIFYIIYKVLGGTGSYEGTVRFISYASAVMALSWIPLIGWFFGLYEIYLYIVGGMIVHDVSMVKSAIAVLLPTFVVILLAIVAAMFVLSSVFSNIFI
ncbi:hypothetical protein EO98_05800 [Methanosarcina sp. 2.H.T.1A.6]|uniref:YIP1 family protein n=1 Tax=unclassified Methanosarcina TaxID=2644672 RepID=UPI0006214E95|nr:MULTISPECIES: YIP1 family protein [unclassified Methanosarcina]KKG11592.1 hypothetical protein EO97_00175 [Methanosarcina sp. 2.H.T.1A.15]KKG14456.1 hypothetical protein EO94_14020 [Methanosarcina sp. 2.H.T.1A.3]KKG24292.1 hypothetical protein EO96_01225 [Methanosarcina sp. 2.H.T.1A.8]KKG24895.1 hypothetical protein EO98_05800 [Methanosarcina sp. 2.H.T.1A.6]KKH49400.1 hypothetical protein EO93_16560 [Methanosarcina sp. 1.H.A.2.2]